MCTTWHQSPDFVSFVMEALNNAHSDSMSPTSCGMHEDLFWRWELKASWQEIATDVPGSPECRSDVKPQDLHIPTCTNMQNS